MTAMTDTSPLEKALGVSFAEPALLRQALVHSSYCHENPAAGLGHNERLEFLGDAVLDMIVAEKLYLDHPDMAEGAMTKRRAALVRRETLARVARDINLGGFLLMGSGEESTGGRKKAANLAGAMEAVIAAVYLARGIDITRDMIGRLLAEEWDKPTDTVRDYKSPLQELTAARFKTMPDYRLTGESGPAHDKRFSVEVLVDGRVMGQAAAKKKQAAENEAARQALERLGEGFTD
jgi:ribonuclease-3